MSEHKNAERKIHRRKYSLLENMFISFMITFAAGVLCFENYMPESFMNVYRPVVFILCIGTWFALSLFSGARNKWLFEVYTVLFWLVPQLIIYLANDGPEIFRMSIIMYLLSEFAVIMFTTPAEVMGSVFRMGAIPVTLIIVLSCSFVFLAGNLFSDQLKKGNYTF